MSGPLYAQKRREEKENAERIARVNAEQLAMNPSGLELPPWVQQQPMAPQQPMTPQQSTTPPLQQLALHKRAPVSEAAALSQALRGSTENGNG